ncbi:hypothetical protein [Desulfatibacillum alkenivorans]|uniref:hypothetical protein n=1 Tax=Desulfatibacillum alkenivorans TaxID=259354 RepID=UPI0009360D8B|nr:hypothetical protein [Desulfatibacillum alkenivorans]
MAGLPVYLDLAHVMILSVKNNLGSPENPFIQIQAVDLENSGGLTNIAHGAKKILKKLRTKISITTHLTLYQLRLILWGGHEIFQINTCLRFIVLHVRMLV